MPIALYEPFDPRVAAIWRQLEAVARPAYFLCWGWIETWLRSLGEDAPPLAVVHADDGPPAAAFFVTHQHARRPRHLLRTTALHLGAFGDGRSGLLRAPGAAVGLADIVEALPGWDHVVMPAIERGAVAELARLAPAYRVRVERQAGAPYVDLDTVRAAAGGYLAVLDPETRVQLQHARREVGELTIERARDVPQALALLDELLRLRARDPHARGPFAEAHTVDVHRRLIAARMPHGELELQRIAADDVTLGVLYAFVAHGRVAIYEAGFEAFADPHVQPALLCHAAAIEHAAAGGHAFYDLAAADAWSRAHLATGRGELAWLRVERPSPSERLRGRVRRARRAVARRLAPVPVAS